MFRLSRSVIGLRAFSRSFLTYSSAGWRAWLLRPADWAGDLPWFSLLFFCPQCDMLMQAWCDPFMVVVLHFLQGGLYYVKLVPSSLFWKSDPLSLPCLCSSFLNMAIWCNFSDRGGSSNLPSFSFFFFSFSFFFASSPSMLPPAHSYVCYFSHDSIFIWPHIFYSWKLLACMG